MYSHFEFYIKIFDGQKLIITCPILTSESQKGALSFGNAIGFMVPPALVVGPQNAYNRFEFNEIEFGYVIYLTSPLMYTFWQIVF